MEKKEENDVGWNLLRFWICIPRIARLAFLWFVILGISFLGWVKIIRRLFESE